MNRRPTGVRLRRIAGSSAVLLSLLAAVAAPAAGRSDMPDRTDDGAVTDDSLLPLAAGTTVATIDAAVVPASALSITDAADGEPAPGLLASYFTTADLSGPPALERVEPSVAYRADAPTEPGLSPAAGGDELPTPTPGVDIGSVRWSGVLTAPVDGTYRLELATSGSARVLLDDAVVTATADPQETPQETPPTPTTPPAGPTTGPTAAAPEPLVASVDLEAGAAHALVVEYVADEPEGADRYTVLGWTPPPGALAPLVPEAVDAAAAADVPSSSSAPSSRHPWWTRRAPPRRTRRRRPRRCPPNRPS